MQFIFYWLLECLIGFIFDLPVILVTWFYAKWYYTERGK